MQESYSDTSPKLAYGKIYNSLSYGSYRKTKWRTVMDRENVIMFYVLAEADRFSVNIQLEIVIV